MSRTGRRDADWLSREPFLYKIKFSSKLASDRECIIETFKSTTNLAGAPVSICTLHQVAGGAGPAAPSTICTTAATPQPLPPASFPVDSVSIDARHPPPVVQPPQADSCAPTTTSVAVAQGEAGAAGVGAAGASEEDAAVGASATSPGGLKRGVGDPEEELPKEEKQKPALKKPKLECVLRRHK